MKRTVGCSNTSVNRFPVSKMIEGNTKPDATGERSARLCGSPKVCLTGAGHRGRVAREGAEAAFTPVHEHVR